VEQQKRTFEKIGFRHALNGILAAIKKEHNLKIHLMAATVVFAAGFVLQVSATEWLFLVVAISLVWISEFFNTAIEELCDLISSEHDPRLGSIKDIASGAVLLAAIFAAAIGLIVFVPKLVRLTF
jgi:diacylglycerol kinase